MFTWYRHLFIKYAGHKVWPAYYAVNAKLLALGFAIGVGMLFKADLAIFSFFWAFALIDFTNMIILKKKESALKVRNALFKKCAIHKKEFDILRKRMSILRVFFAVSLPVASYFLFNSFIGAVYVFPVCYMGTFILSALTLPKFMARAKEKGLVTEYKSKEPASYGIPGVNFSGGYTGSPTAFGGMSN